MKQITWHATLALVAVIPYVAGAQTSSISGTVRDRSGLGLQGAEIVVRGSAETARTDLAGRFALGDLAPGERELIARRLGFRPETVRVVVTGPGISELEVRLTPSTVVFRPIVVSGRSQDYNGRLAEFYRRVSARRGGQFLTRKELDEGNPSSLIDVFRRVSGMNRASRGRSGRARQQTCAPHVFLDGFAMPSGRLEVDISSFPPSSLEGVEVYTSSNHVPARFQRMSHSQCGTILLWSRDARVEAQRHARFKEARDLEKLVSQGVFTADQVHTPARPVEDGVPSIQYPPELHALRIGGVVVAEVVVDSAGLVEEGSFGVVSSPHPLLSAAVAEALPHARFVAAEREGRKVRQLVQMPFQFRPLAGKDH